MSDSTIYAKDLPCCKCGKKSEENKFFPVFDPDIPSYPYCRKCLDKAKLELMIMLTEGDKRKNHDTNP